MRSAIAFALLFVVGCSSSVALKSGPTKISGKVSTADGKPVGGILLTLQPLEDGHMAPIEVAKDGTFSGELIPGKYAYFVGKSATSKSSDQVLKQLSPKYLEADLNRTVQVTPGEDLAIAFD